MKKYLVEFIGTFFLIFTIVLTVNNGTGSFAPLAIGAVLMVAVYAGGHISGAHYNPAVTLAVYLRGKFSAADIAPYIIAQLAGAVLAALIATHMLSHISGATIPDATVSLPDVPALLAEFLGTFLLVYVILQTATTESTAGNSYYGLAIGFTVTAMAYTLGPISGGAFNPAVALGVTVAKMASWSDIWIFLVANFLSAAVAALVFGVVYGKRD